MKVVTREQVRCRCMGDDDCKENREVRFLDGSSLPSIPYLGKGDYHRGEWPKNEPCHDCHCLPGKFHHPGCDMEICPRCKQQAIECECLNDWKAQERQETYRTPQKKRAVRKSRRMAGKVALVTGGSGGIGFATAEAFIDGGYDRVWLADVKPPKRGTCRTGMEYVRCDVGKHADVCRTFKRIRRVSGRLDVLVNCAGIHNAAKMRAATPADFDEIMRVNMRGVFLTCVEALWLMNKGVVINVASAVGIAVDKDAALYSASKAWVIHFTKCMALDYGRSVRFNSIAPGPVDTPMLRAAFKNNKTVIEQYRAMNPRGFASPQEIARLILFMTSDDCYVVNGATWTADGGESIFYGGEPAK